MKITELEWLKKNIEKVSLPDVERLKELGVFRIMQTGEINLPLSKFVATMEEVADIVERYINDELNTKESIGGK